MNAKVEQKAQSHETILDSAARFVRERGIAGARVSDVMKGAGLTVGGFYAHFESKQDLVDQALRRTAGMLRDHLFSGIDKKPDKDRAEVILKRYLSRTHRDGEALGCPFPAVVGEIATTAPEHGGALAETVESLASRLAELLPSRREISPRLLALGLVALMYGGLSLARAVKGTALSDEVLQACRALGAMATRPRSAPMLRATTLLRSS
jgi:TetR/AcrR family transcriptional repressor of nem operon